MTNLDTADKKDLGCITQLNSHIVENDFAWTVKTKMELGLTLMLGLPKSYCPNTKLRIYAIFYTYIQALLYSENNVLNPPKKKQRYSTNFPTRL